MTLKSGCGRGSVFEDFSSFFLTLTLVDLDLDLDFSSSEEEVASDEEDSPW